MNDRTALGLRDRAEIALQPLGPQHVKGRSEPVEVYAVDSVDSVQAIVTRPA